MLTLTKRQHSVGFSAMNADELFFINGGSGSGYNCYMGRNSAPAISAAGRTVSYTPQNPSKIAAGQNLQAFGQNLMTDTGYASSMTSGMKGSGAATAICYGVGAASVLIGKAVEKSGQASVKSY